MLAILFVVTFLTPCYAAGNNTTTPTAFIYEKSNKDKQFLSYTSLPRWFNDIRPAMATLKMKKIGQICVTGLWILYPLPDFQADKLKDIQLVHGLKSPNCFQPKSLVMSMQPLSDYSHMGNYVLNAFPQVNFTGKSSILKSYDFGQRFGRVKSLIMNGPVAMEIMSKHGKTYCIVPGKKVYDPDLTKRVACAIAQTKKIFHTDNDLGTFVGYGCSKGAVVHEVDLEACVELQNGSWDMDSLINKKKKTNK